MWMKNHSAAATAALALGLFLAPPASIAVDAIINTVALVPAAIIGTLRLHVRCHGSAGRAHAENIRRRSIPTTGLKRSYRTLSRSWRSERRAQIDSFEVPLPDQPGQAVYLARSRLLMSNLHKDLTDALPSKIGRPNKF